MNTKILYAMLLTNLEPMLLLMVQWSLVYGMLWLLAELCMALVQISAALLKKQPVKYFSQTKYKWLKRVLKSLDLQASTNSKQKKTQSIL